MKISKEQKVEVILYPHSDQSSLLRKLTDVDLKIFFGFITIQILMGNFLLSQNLTPSLIKSIGLGSVDIVFAVVCVIFLLHNYRRRKEAVETIKNCNSILKLDQSNIYKNGITVNGNSYLKKHWFIYGYVIGIVGSTLGNLVILFSNSF